MKVRKGSGKLVAFNPNKVRASLRRTGASPQLIDEVMAEVEPKVKDGMSTGQIYAMVHKVLKKKNTCVACRYNLRDALFKLGPAGFKFEHYVASILNAYGYHAEVPENELPGVCVDHEVDVIAEKDKRRIMIEAKFRNDPTHYVNLKDTMATWSRFLDLVDAARVKKGADFDEVWIVTNARFSDRSRAFGVCKGMRLIGWNYPKEHSLEQMVDHNLLYPLTVIDGLTQSELDRLSKKGWMLCKEVADRDGQYMTSQTGIPQERMEEIKAICKEVIQQLDV